jgi:hypothetical protein
MTSAKNWYTKHTHQLVSMIAVSTLPRAGLWPLLLLLVLFVEAAAAWVVVVAPHRTLLAFPCNSICRGPAQQQASSSSAAARQVSGRLYNTGGWGIGPQRELTPEEFAKRGGSGGSSVRRPTTGYELRDRGEFMRQVSRDKASLQSDALEELLEVAAAAGIKVKDPKERLYKFSSEETSIEDEDELDLSVPLDDAAMDATPTKSKTAKDTDSITRLDEDTGALGVW